MFALAPFPTPPEGLVIDLVTPLTEAGRLDGKSFARLMARLAPMAGGLLVGGPWAGEALNLPRETRLELLSQALAAIHGRMPLLWGITGQSWEETRELAAFAREECRRENYSGPVFLVDLPLWYHSNRGLPRVCQDLFQAASMPLILLNLPEVVRRPGMRFKHLNIRTHVFKKLAALPGITGMIYQGEMRRFLNYHYAAGRRPGFVFYEADEANFLTRPGGWGVVSVGAQLLPDLWQQAVRICLYPEEAADDPGARFKLMELSQLLMKVARLCRDAPAALAKAVLAEQGILSRAGTAPGTPAAPEERKKGLLALAVSISTMQQVHGP
jgi:dihydrodipicolinate synthase/N-acetylneuraminate lyase